MRDIECSSPLFLSPNVLLAGSWLEREVSFLKEPLLGCSRQTEQRQPCIVGSPVLRHTQIRLLPKVERFNVALKSQPSVGGRLRNLRRFKKKEEKMIVHYA